MLVIYPVLTTRSYGEALVYVVFPQTTPIAVGERLNVDIHIADAQGVVGYELTVGFDPTVLRSERMAFSVIDKPRETLKSHRRGKEIEFWTSETVGMTLSQREKVRKYRHNYWRGVANFASLA